MVASVLREAIITGHLRANEPLPQDEIAAQLRVSHIPVREALRQLESEGLVTYQPNRGATVSALTSEEIREIYEIRVILETAANTSCGHPAHSAPARRRQGATRPCGAYSRRCPMGCPGRGIPRGHLRSRRPAPPPG